MNQILYLKRCQCKKKLVVTKKPKSITKSKVRVFQYPKRDENEIISKTFQVKYEKKLSSTAKLLLNSFQNKYIYYAIDDILYSFKLNSAERKNLLTILYSPIISLQNNFSVNFFNIWIREIYIDEISKSNKFLKTNSQTLKQFSSIRIKFFYKTNMPIKKRESLW